MIAKAIQRFKWGLGMGCSFPYFGDIEVKIPQDRHTPQRVRPLLDMVNDL
jgi:hypothetical protein